MRTSALIITSCNGRNDRHCLYPSTPIFYGETTRVRNMKIVDAQFVLFCARKKSRKKGLHTGVRYAILTAIDI